MKKHVLLSVGGYAAAVLVLGGCAEKPSRSAEPGLKTPPVSAPTNSLPAPAAPNATQALQAAAAEPSAPFEETGWQPMFAGHDLKGWRETPFAGHGEIVCQAGLLVLNMGDPFTGVNWTNDFPSMNYEIALDAMRVMGSDFFCGLTVPAGTNCCSLIVGGWGGSLVGISSLDGMDASENETAKFVNFEQNRWYRIRLRMTQRRIEAWIDHDKLVDVITTGRSISLRPGEIELSAPFGLAAWSTSACYRNIKWRHVDGPAGPPKPSRE